MLTFTIALRDIAITIYIRTIIIRAASMSISLTLRGVASIMTNRRTYCPGGHAHGPEPDELAGPGGWRRGLGAIVAVGLRPCSGAIIVLVFALAQGLFWAGIASTFVMGLGTAITVATIATFAVGAKALAKRLATSRAGYGSLAIRGVEVSAALLVILSGVLLLTGYMASERMGMF